MSTSSIGDKFSRLAALRPSRKAAARESSPMDGDPGEVARFLGATLGRNRYGEHLVIRRWFPTPEPCLESNDVRRTRALKMLLPNGASESGSKHNLPPIDALANDPAQWLFLDTETTGLAGGSGTYAFLVGVAWWESGGLQVEQFFMRDFAEEHSLLLALDERLAERRVLVTFNGKSFDWPLLETRFRMTRAIAPRTPSIHLDLLHPSRQLWRPRLASVRLAELERHVLRVSPGSRLDWSRDCDVDSSQIPEIYFNFVRGGSAEPLLPVIRHNQMDLRGLAALAGHILEMIAAQQDEDFPGEVKTPDEAIDLFGMSRLLGRRGEAKLARKTCQAALTAGLPGEHDRAARRDLARLAKRAGDLGGAVEMWESLLSPRQGRSPQLKNSAEQSLALERIMTRGAIGSNSFFAEGSQLRAALEACEQLAIHFEHRARALERASQVTRHGLALVHRARTAQHVDEFSRDKAFCRKWLERLEYRLARIERKAAGMAAEHPIEQEFQRD
jgi:uncharacterized protein YprB with RNaseH-like and TPR domain